MVDPVERACQVRVEDPYPLGPAAQGGEQVLDRVVTAATRPKPIRSGLEPSLPFRLQCLTNSCLMAPVHDHRDAERARLGLVTGLRYVHPPDRRRSPRASRGVHLHRHLRPSLAGQRDQPVNSRGPAALVALRHLPNADQRVRPASQCELLQVPDLGQVPVPNRLEDPAPQPPYPLLAASPVHPFPGVTVEHRARVLGSVHRSVQLIPQLQHPRPRSLQRPTCPRQHP